MLVLSSEDVMRAVPMEAAVEAAGRGYAALSSGSARIPLRTPVEAGAGVSLFMPGFVPGEGALGLKLVSVFPGNPSRGLPVINALVVLCDPGTGAPAVAMEGACLTALRTGAGSGVATRLLARPDAAVVAVLGAGVQAGTQLEAVCAVRPIREARVFAPTAAHAAGFAREMGGRLAGRGVSVSAVGSADEAVRGADVVVAATTSKAPVFGLGALKPDAHVNGVGSFTPEMQELGEDVLTAASKLVVDTREGALAEAGDIIVPMKKGTLREADIHAEVGEIVLGRRPGREPGDGITVFKSVGTAVLDLAVGMEAYRRALELGLGVELDLRRGGSRKPRQR